MVVNRLTERMDFDGAEQKRNRSPVTVPDRTEFPSLKRMEDFLGPPFHTWQAMGSRRI